MENGAFAPRETSVSFVYSMGKGIECCYQSRKERNNLIRRTVLILAVSETAFLSISPSLLSQREHHSLCEQMGRLSRRGEL